MAREKSKVGEKDELIGEQESREEDGKEYGRMRGKAGEQGFARK